MKLENTIKVYLLTIKYKKIGKKCPKFEIFKSLITTILFPSTDATFSFLITLLQKGTLVPKQ